MQTGKKTMKVGNNVEYRKINTPNLKFNHTGIGDYETSSPDWGVT